MLEFETEIVIFYIIYANHSILNQFSIISVDENNHVVIEYVGHEISIFQTSEHFIYNFDSNS